jgi:hypothetical protein
LFLFVPTTPRSLPMAKEKIRTDYAQGKKEFKEKFRILCKEYAWLKNQPPRKRRKKSPWPVLTLEEQARRAPIINALCRELDQVMPRNGETVAHFKQRTGISI